jgi:hypothetical protein
MQNEKVTVYPVGDKLFYMRLRVAGTMLHVRGYDAYGDQSVGPHHYPVRVVAVLAGIRVSTFVMGIPGHECIDGAEAREHAVAWLAVKPGDTDADFFADMDPLEIEFREQYGEELSMIAEVMREKIEARAKRARR